MPILSLVPVLTQTETLVLILTVRLTCTVTGTDLQTHSDTDHMANENVTLQRMDFKALSVQSIPNFKSDFIYTY